MISFSKNEMNADRMLKTLEKAYRKNGLSKDATAAALDEARPCITAFVESQKRQVNQLSALVLRIGEKYVMRA